MVKVIFFSVISSAAIYAASFLGTPIFWWGIFFFLMPLFFVLQYHNLSFWYGFLWGSLSYGVLFSAVWLVSIEYGTGWFRYIAPSIVVIWIALWSGFWFVLLTLMRKYAGLKRFFLQTSITTIYFIVVHYFVLFPFVFKTEGYPFVYPLIPLMYKVSPFLLSILHKEGVLFLLVFIQLWSVQRNKLTFLLCVFFFVNVSRREEKWKNDIICTAEKWQYTTPYERAQEICHHLIVIQKKWPEKKVIVLPESTFPYVLTEHIYAIKMWTENVLHEDKYLILGAYRKEKKLFNSFFIIHKGRIIYYYDKKHLITFFEKEQVKLPIFKKGNSLFLSKKESFTAGTSDPTPFLLASSDKIFPLICSESFWAMPSKVKTIALINDSYFYLAYFPLTMQLLAIMNALEAKTDILYCSLWSSTVDKNKLKGSI